MSITRFLTMAALVTSVATPLHAQIPGTLRTDRIGVTLEVMRPQFVESEGFEQSGATVFLSAYAQLKPGTYLQIELPFVFWKVSATGFSESSSTFGNPYLGLQLQKGRMTFDVGGRLPLVDGNEPAAALGFLADLERFDAFFSGIATVQALSRIDLTSPSGLGLAIFAGPEGWFDTEDDSEIENELLVTYGLETLFRSRGVLAGARISGRVIMTEPDHSFGQRSVHQLGAFVEVGSARVRPTIQLRVPLEKDMRETSKWSAGLGLRVGLGDRS